MLCLVGQHTSPLLPFVVPNLPHKPPLCCQLLLHPQITSAHYCPLYKCAHRQTHTNVAPEALLHPQIEVHTDNLARNHLRVCSIHFAALYSFRGEAIEATWKGSIECPQSTTDSSDVSLYVIRNIPGSHTCTNTQNAPLSHKPTHLIKLKSSHVRP